MTKTTPRKRPQQARSKAMVEAILEATIRVLIELGYEGATTIAIAARAGVSVGSLYQYFPNKESLVAALIERHVVELVACVDAALASVGNAEPREGVRALIRAGVDAHRLNPALHKIFSEEIPRVGQFKVAMNTSKVLTERLATYLTMHAARLGGRDPKLLAFVVETVVEALTHRAVIDRLGASSIARVEAEAVDLVFAYLFRREFQMSELRRG